MEPANTSQEEASPYNQGTTLKDLEHNEIVT
jgi:hypothetical protein